MSKKMKMCISAVALLAAGLLAGRATAVEWVRAGLGTELPRWGLEGGLQFGIHPGPLDRADGPRGLVRLRSPTLSDGEYDLINFLAIEPVVKGQRGLSELERSRLDNAPGKRIWPAPGGEPATSGGLLQPGTLTAVAPGIEQLQVTLRVEPFDNGAHVSVTITQRSDRPDEISLAVHAEPDSAPLDLCVLTATMGNKIRARRLWLKDEVADSRRLYGDYKGHSFAPHTAYPLDRLHRTAEGDVLVALTTDEKNPAEIVPVPGTRRWRYAGAAVTQYWRAPKGSFHEKLRAVVNARNIYYASQWPIPGGIAFENFELQEPFREGQSLVFGITRRTPAELGFALDKRLGTP